MSAIRGTRARSASRLLCVVVVLLSALAFAPSAWALTIEKDKDAPIVGEDITFTVVGPNECSHTYTFKVDGTTQPDQPQASPSFTTSFSTAGTHTVVVDIDYTSGGCSDESLSLEFEVSATLGGSIKVTPDPPRPNQTATLEALQTGGYGPPYSYEWDTDNDGDFDDATKRTVSIVWPTTGPRVVRVRIRDDAPNQHEVVVTRTIEVKDPPPGTPPPPPPPPCVDRLAFALSEFTTDGCFTKIASQPEQWETTAAIKLNGVSFPDYGQRFVITLPTSEEPGGHFSTTGAAIQVGDLTAYSGDIEWELPDGEQGEEAAVRTFAVPDFVQLFGLPVVGSAEMRLGWGDDDEYYATFSFNIELPAIFTPGPSADSGSVTGGASVRVDDEGPHFDGLKISVTDVWLGRIKVPEACFSYIPAGGQTIEPCDAPSLDGEPYIACETDVNTDRWDGNAVLELPVESQTRYAVFGGLADGRLANFGGFADNLAPLGIQIVPGVFLNRLGAGVCLEPPPLTVRGDVGLQVLGGKLLVNGYFIYTDDYPWSVEVGGNATLAGTELGSGFLKFNAWGNVDFALQSGINLFDVASIDGRIEGWIEPPKFNISGSVKGCIADVICAEALGLVSSVGVAGCIDAGTITVYEPYAPRTGPFGFGSISFSTREHVIPLRAGFGHVWGTSSVDLLGNSCDFSPYSATRSVSAWAAAAGITQRIAPGTKAVSLRIHGSDGPPKVIVRGPDGTEITSPEDGSTKERKGRYLLAENTTDGTTNVLLIKPAAGTWTIKGVPGAESEPTKVDRSNFQTPATFVGRIRRTDDGRRDFVMAYSTPPGTSVRLVERGKSIARTLVRDVRGERCEGDSTVRGGRKLRCTRVKFRPSRGPARNRRIQAIVSRAGIPVTREDVVSYRVARETLPSRPGRLRARRRRGDLIVIFPRSRGASRYTVSASLGDGRRLGFDLGRKCRAVRIEDVPREIAALVKVAGVRYDLAVGRYRKITLDEGDKSAGPRRRMPRRICS